MATPKQIKLKKKSGPGETFLSFQIKRVFELATTGSPRAMQIAAIQHQQVGEHERSRAHIRPALHQAKLRGHVIVEKHLL